MLPRLEWAAVRNGAEKIGCQNFIPAELQESQISGNDEEFLKRLHHVLFEVDVVEGELECPETGRKFPIKDGIPNMLLNEDEV